TGGQEVMVTIDRDAAMRLGVNVKMLDTMLNNAFSQRQIATIYKTLNQYTVVMMLQSNDTAQSDELNKIYVLNSAGDRI
ncbi:efflux RND transporter permease subunit, partial [Rosenbergiella nectarea]|uniref:efflux RND transporter permease subunit n=1 Tax=Rosenbergiella nectarea TaxID=988801 RepID=UPI001F4E9159